MTTDLSDWPLVAETAIHGLVLKQVQYQVPEGHT